MENPKSPKTLQNGSKSTQTEVNTTPSKSILTTKVEPGLPVV